LFREDNKSQQITMPGWVVNIFQSHFIKNIDWTSLSKHYPSTSILM
jgi:hypothetical protein